MATRKRRHMTAVGMLAASTLLLSGCLQDPNGGGSAGAAGLDGYVDNNQTDDDKVVTILGAYGGDEQTNFEASLKPFEDETGIDIQYTSDTDFTTTIKSKVRSGDTPDIGFFPQPGGLLELAADGYVQPIDTFLDYDEIDRTLVPGLLESVRLNGRVYGAPMRLANKSLIWYPKKYWDEQGFETPKTLDDLYEIASKIESQGITPWCMAWNADQATGWVGTDWIEQYVLTLQGPDVYNQWTSHEIPFDDPQIVEAFDEFGKVATADGQVYGGVKGVVNTTVAESMFPAFEDPPKCVLERQGSFEVSFLPADVQADLDSEVGVIPFPAADDSGSTAILGGGDLAALFNGDDEDAIAVMEFLTSDEFGVEWAQAGGWLSPHTTFDVENYPNQTTKDIAESSYGASAVVFDGSDVMPKEVGSGTFWTGMVDWIQGKDSQSTAADIESSWPQ